MTENRIQTSYTKTDYLLIGSSLIAGISSVVLGALGISGQLTDDAALGLSVTASAFGVAAIGTFAYQIIQNLKEKNKPKIAVYPAYSLPFPSSIEKDAFAVMTGHITYPLFHAEMAKVTEEEARELAKKMTKSDFADADFFSDDKVFFKGLKALEMGLINAHQMATLASFDDTFHYFRKVGITPVTLSLFHGDQLNEKGWRLLDTARNGCSHLYQMNATEREAFLKMVAALPPSEQQFLLVPIIPDLEKGGGKQMWKALLEVSSNPYVVDIDGKKYHIVPSCGMRMAHSLAKYGENAVLMKPQFGPWSDEEVGTDWLEGAHVIGIPHRYGNLPEELVDADGYITEAGFTFTQHDDDHCKKASPIPQEHRTLFHRLAAAVPREERLSLSEKERQKLFEFDDLGKTFYVADHYSSRYSSIAFYATFTHHVQGLSDKIVLPMLKYLMDITGGKEKVIDTFFNFLSQDLTAIVPRDLTVPLKTSCRRILSLLAKI